MDLHDAQLPGNWHRNGQEHCAAGYAEHLHLQSNGLYSGSSEPAGTFTWWDQGTWKLQAPGKLALSTANDEVVTYTYSLNDGTLTFTDPAGCRFSYRRMP